MSAWLLSGGAHLYYTLDRIRKVRTIRKVRPRFVTWCDTGEAGRAAREMRSLEHDRRHPSGGNEGCLFVTLIGFSG